MLSEDKIIFKNWASVGKSGMEAYFLNEGISIVRTAQSSKSRRLALPL